MSIKENAWVILLAGGEGVRLRPLTTRGGVAVPKQFCSLYGGPSLLQETLHRAAKLATHPHVCAVVTERHRQWWEQQLWPLDEKNILVQPASRGTAHGILFPLLHIMQRDPDAQVIVLPCDHYVRDEAVLNEAIRHALLHVRLNDSHPVLLGIEPEHPDPELGYIVPAPVRGSAVSKVLKFVEKPTVQRANELICDGALWNAFIIVSSVRALLKMYEERMKDMVEEMRIALQRQREGNSMALVDLYQRLPVLDFSRYILQSEEHALRVLSVPPCGWSDLGTPDRVGAALRHLPGDIRVSAAHATTIHVNLAAQHARLASAGMN
ncbi:MAG TPA: sugar phosphate nucleotidyltransferase [Steroidobacteraceae bacterium]|jgi:mannose-1-phosphate guanylyltransferase|nr:sugar phosphate nucleotidyltransferase [Steroidobacteraceae bacterium]